MQAAKIFDVSTFTCLCITISVVFFSSGNPFLEGTKINSPFYLAKLNAPKGTTRFTLVVSQYEKTSTIHYTIKVCFPKFHYDSVFLF